MGHCMGSSKSKVPDIERKDLPDKPRKSLGGDEKEDTPKTKEESRN